VNTETVYSGRREAVVMASIVHVGTGTNLIELSATLLLSRLAAVLFYATPGRRQNYSRSIEFA
jgi:hypothetical protein